MAALLGVLPAAGVEVFPDGKLALQPGATLSAGDTMGGYPIFKGHEGWRLDQAKSDLVIGPSTLPMGFLRLTHFQGNTLVAVQNVSANLATRPAVAGWRGGRCSQEQLYKKSAYNGNATTCLSVRPATLQVSNRSVTFLFVSVENAGPNGTFHAIEVGLNLEVLGFLGTVESEWTEAVVQSQARRRALLDAVVRWGEQLQSASNRAFQEKDAGAGAVAAVPSYMSLQSVPMGLADRGYSFGFIGAAIDLPHRASHSALAFSPIEPGRTRWANSVAQPTQADANARAIENCERERAPSRPPCVLYVPPTSGSN